MIDWPVLKQLIFMFSSILEAIFNGLESVGIINVGLSLIIFSFICQLFLLPFGIRSGLQEKKNRKRKEALAALAEEYKDKIKDSETLKSEYEKKKAEIEGQGKPKKMISILIVLLQIFLIFCMLSSISYMYQNTDVLQQLNDDEIIRAYTFLGMDLRERGLMIGTSLFIPLAYVIAYFVPAKIRKYKAEKKAEEKRLAEMTDMEREMMEEEKKNARKFDPLNFILSIIGIIPILLLAWLSLSVPRFFVLYWFSNMVWKTAQLYIASVVHNKALPIIEEKRAKKKEKIAKGVVDCDAN